MPKIGVMRQHGPNDDGGTVADEPQASDESGGSGHQGVKTSAGL